MAGLSGLIVEQQEREIWARIQVAVAEERERCANMVPMNWCDPLLTGPKAVKLPVGHARAVEALLRGIRDRIRAQS